MVVRLRAGWHGRLDAKLTTPHPLCCLTLDLSSTTDYSYALCPFNCLKSTGFNT